MGAIIEAIAATESRSPLGAESSITLAADAACRVLADAGRTLGDVGLLINTGVFRDDNIGEPAMAPLIQCRLETLAPRRDPNPSTFSFDISNGACGLLTGLEIASGFVSSGSIERGLIVTSDVNATPNVSGELSCAPVGAAVLLAPGNANEGFTAFRTDTYAKYSDRFEAVVRWLAEDERVASAPHERQAIRVHEAEDYVAQCAEVAMRSLPRFLDEHCLRLQDIDLIVPSQAPIGFPSAFAEAASPDVRSRCADPIPEIPGAHTVGPALAIEAALASARGAAARNLLFVAAGSGITVAMALYTKPLAAGRSSSIR